LDPNYRGIPGVSLVADPTSNRFLTDGYNTIPLAGKLFRFLLAIEASRVSRGAQYYRVDRAVTNYLEAVRVKSDCHLVSPYVEMLGIAVHTH
jgi:hypothetical protein